MDNVFDTMDGLPAEDLAKGFREGDRALVSRLYEVYFVKLCDFCYHLLRDSHEAEDVVSHIFERLLCNDIKVERELHTPDDIANYLYVAAKTRCLNVLERNKKKRIVYNACTEKPQYGDAEKLDLAFAQAVGDAKLLDKVYNLPYRSIEVLRKLYFEDKSHEEIAREMGIAKPTVQNLRVKGLARLLKELNREDFILHIFVLLAAAGVI
jgi:RNA polymerase sigma-70 factor (ECF subfamily)